jgi:hypothetical protein
MVHHYLEHLSKEELRATYAQSSHLFSEGNAFHLLLNYYFGDALHDKDMPFLPKRRLELFADFAEGLLILLK